MADVSDVTNGEPGPVATAETVQDKPTTDEPTTDEPTTDKPTADKPTTAAGAQQQVAPPAPHRRVWSMPTSPVSRTQADKFGRLALDAVVKATRSTAGVIAAVARFGARVVTAMWRAIEAVPSAVKLFAVAGLLMLVGVVGAIALDNAAGLICTVVVIPVSSLILGALGQRWYTGLGNQQAQVTGTRAIEPAASELHRSVEYVDKKLAVALNTFGTERHQQAVIALFQAKTAVELTLGTEQDTTNYGGVPLPADDLNPRPRIRVGSASKSLLRESNSLAAS